MLILASSSPRRKEILEKFNIEFIIDTESINEYFDHNVSIEEALNKVSLTKGVPISKKHPNDIVLSADTIVVVEGKIFGKPHDKEEAIYMLNKLQNNYHYVLTSVTLFKDGKVNQFIERTKVHFTPMTDKEILDYIDNNNVYDKAGSYAIQDEAGKYIDRIEGSYYNVMGLPIERVIEELKKLTNK